MSVIPSAAMSVRIVGFVERMRKKRMKLLTCRVIVHDFLNLERDCACTFIQDRVLGSVQLHSIAHHTLHCMEW